MQTHTEIVMAEAQRLERAWRYEKLSGNIATLKREIARLEPQLAKFDSEIALLQKMAKLAQDISSKTVGNGGFLARETIIANIAGACSFNEQQRDKIAAKLTLINRELPKLEAQLAEFTAPTA